MSLQTIKAALSPRLFKDPECWSGTMIIIIVNINLIKNMNQDVWNREGLVGARQGLHY